MKFVARTFALPALALVAIAIGCGGSTGEGTLASCQTSSDCADSEVCIGLNGTGECHIQCSASASECSGSASCQGIGGISVDVCKKEDDDSSATGGGSTESEDEPSDDWLRCSKDTECAAFDATAVCGTWKGDSYCTVTCSSDDECNPPAALGVTTHFIACSADEKNGARKICVPRLECFDDPTSCISGLPTDPDGSGGTSSGGTGSGGTSSGGAIGDTGGSPGTGGFDFGTGGFSF